MDPGISVAMNTRSSKPISNQTPFSRKNYENQHIQRIKISKFSDQIGNTFTQEYRVPDSRIYFLITLN